MIFIYIFYADVFCIQSYLMKLLCLLLVAQIHGRSIKNYLIRFFCYSILFTALEMATLLGRLAYPFYIVTSLLGAPVMFFLAFGIHSLKERVRYSFEGLVMMIAVNGCGLAIRNIFHRDIPGVLILGSSFWLVKTGLWFLERYKRERVFERWILLRNEEKEKEVPAYVDSGNRLYYRQRIPVSFLAPSIIKELGLEPVDSIVYETVGDVKQSSILYRVPRGEMEHLVMENFYVADGGNALENGTYRMILHRDLEKGKENG